jgi:uncharacterized protein (TIGR03067 family)
MKRLAVIVFAALSATAVWSADAKEEAKMLEGTWRPTEAEFAGNKYPDETLKTIKLVLTADAYTVEAGKNIDKGTYKVAPDKKPKELDITGTEGPNKDKTFLAIYEVNGDTLRICYDLEGKKRPTEFKTAKDTQQFLIVYKRDKK